jgi:cyanate permease
MLSLLFILAAFSGILFFAGALSLHAFLICALVAGLIFCLGACIAATRSRDRVRTGSPR